MIASHVSCRKSPVTSHAALGEDGGVVIEYGILLATIIFLVATAAQPLVTAVGNWFTTLAGLVRAI